MKAGEVAESQQGAVDLSHDMPISGHPMSG